MNGVEEAHLWNTSLSYLFGGASLNDFIFLKEYIRILEPKFSFVTDFISSAHQSLGFGDFVSPQL